MRPGEIPTGLFVAGLIALGSAWIQLPSLELSVDMSDAVYNLRFEFLSGPAPVQGTACIVVIGCPDNPNCP